MKDHPKIRLFNVINGIIFILISIIMLIPIYKVLVDSFDLSSAYGMRLWPKQFGLAGYASVLSNPTLYRPLLISVGTTLAGTFLGLALSTLGAYVLIQWDMPGRTFFANFLLFAMIFNGGMISSYVVNTQFLNLKNSIWALILPLCVSSFNVVICKTFFKTNIPESIIESAQIDGATQFQIFGKIALPLSKPLMATIALFLTFGYWNDWFQSSLYISDTKLYSLQALLDHVQRNIEMMANNPSLGVTTAQYMNSMPKEGARMAMAIIIIIPIACCYPFFQKYFISGLTVGAVKG